MRILVVSACAALLWLVSARGWLSVNGDQFFQQTHIPLSSEQLMQVFKQASEAPRSSETRP
ncbi:MAG: hypothetical protein EBX49_08490 [Synechococcaceae bacterium WB8_1B_136]|nr:hypothetical protein [Synechococcaceae bacterium WB8_1B_136]